MLTAPKRSGSIHGINCAMKINTAITAYTTMLATKAAAKRPIRKSRLLIGFEKIKSAVPNSKSRSKALLTNTPIISMPNKVNMLMNCTITVGALRYTLPIAPPNCTASLDDAPKAIKPNRQDKSHNKGERNCSRSSKLKNSRIIRRLLTLR